MRLVILESPFAGDIETNIKYARACMKDCLLHGEAPYASHLLYTQEGVLDDTIPEERRLGMEAGFAWARAFEWCEPHGPMAGAPYWRVARVVYTDLGISKGMQEGIERAQAIGQDIEYRTLKGW